MTDKVFYKCVQVYNGKLVSFCQNELFPEEFRVIYSTTEETFPVIPTTKLFVFDELDMAQTFINRQYAYFGTVQIWKCTVKNPETVDEIAVPSSVAMYWTGSCYGKMTPPNGTYLVDSLTLVEKVHEELF